MFDPGKMERRRLGMERAEEDKDVQEKSRSAEGGGKGVRAVI